MRHVRGPRLVGGGKRFSHGHGIDAPTAAPARQWRVPACTHGARTTRPPADRQARTPWVWGVRAIAYSFRAGLRSPRPGDPMKLGENSSATRAVRVLTIDDQAIFRALARDVIEATPGFASVGDAASGEEGLSAVGRLNPDLVLLDVRMPGMSGIEAARLLVARHPEVVVVLISIEERIDVPSAAQLDAVPLVRKQDFGPRLLRRLWDERRR
ncbi:MAG TPA: response regulator transcription factor [Solirubrobacteraceae bacterium]|nr:response regulator transcription factor [Solirubrobacteraceae bacterium]